MLCNFQLSVGGDANTRQIFRWRPRQRVLNIIWFNYTLLKSITVIQTYKMLLNLLFFVRGDFLEINNFIFKKIIYI